MTFFRRSRRYSAVGGTRGGETETRSRGGATQAAAAGPPRVAYPTSTRPTVDRTYRQPRACMALAKVRSLIRTGLGGITRLICYSRRRRPPARPALHRSQVVSAGEIYTRYHEVVVKSPDTPESGLWRRSGERQWTLVCELWFSEGRPVDSRLGISSTRRR